LQHKILPPYRRSQSQFKAAGTIAWQQFPPLVEVSTVVTPPRQVVQGILLPLTLGSAVSAAGPIRIIGLGTGFSLAKYRSCAEQYRRQSRVVRNGINAATGNAYYALNLQET